MRNPQRRGLRLASMLVASGLALSIAPAVHADDSNGILKLTDSQAAEMAGRLMPDVYGDGRSQGDAREAAQAAKATADKTAASAAGADASTAGSGASTDATSPWKLTKKSGIEGAQGMAATFPVGGSKGDYFSVNGLSPIQRVDADGKQKWSRDATSLDTDWQITPSPRGSKEPYPPAVVMGFNAISPFAMASDDGVTTGDLTGDGVDDIVFTAENGVLPYRPFTSPGSSLPNGTFVTVLDGATGKTLWSKLYAAAYNVKLVGKTLVIADSAFSNMNSPALLQGHPDRYPLRLRRRQAHPEADLDARGRALQRRPVGLAPVAGRRPDRRLLEPGPRLRHRPDPQRPHPGDRHGGRQRQVGADREPLRTAAAPGRQA